MWDSHSPSIDSESQSKMTRRQDELESLRTGYDHLDIEHYDPTSIDNTFIPNDYDSAMLEIYRLRGILHHHSELKTNIMNATVQSPRTKRDGVNDDSPDASNDWITRVSWLIGLLFFQSVSSIILQKFESLLRYHPTIVLFLTMLIGSGGNAGSQSTVLAIRGFALGTIRPGRMMLFVKEQVCIGFKLSLILGLAACVRVITSNSDKYEVLAISLSMSVIIVVSVLMGTILPLLMKRCGIDPAHGAPLIQVLMDITGVLIVCSVCSLIFSSLSEDLLKNHIYTEIKGINGEDAAESYINALQAKNVAAIPEQSQDDNLSLRGPLDSNGGAFSP